MGFSGSNAYRGIRLFERERFNWERGSALSLSLSPAGGEIFWGCPAIFGGGRIQKIQAEVENTVNPEWGRLLALYHPPGLWQVDAPGCIYPYWSNSTNCLGLLHFLGVYFDHSAVIYCYTPSSFPIFIN